jgi:hypothetical protein
MNCDDQIPVRILHVLETDIPKNAGIVDQDVDAAKVLNGSLDNLLALCDAVVVGYCLSAGSFDLIDDDIGGLCSASAKVPLFAHADVAQWAEKQLREVIPLWSYPRP